MDLHCPKCLTSRTGDVVGAACQSYGCDGVIAERPAYRTLVDILPERFTCLRRPDYGPFAKSGEDYWEKFKRIDNRVCSYCGSLHPDDMFRLVSEAAAAAAPADGDYHAVVRIEPSDKRYKVYVRQPGVRNAHEGGIKFYMWHLPRAENGDALPVPDTRNAEYAEACRRSRARFEKWMAESFPQR